MKRLKYLPPYPFNGLWKLWKSEVLWGWLRPVIIEAKWKMWRRSRRLYLTEQAAGGGVGLLVRMPAYLTAAFLMLFSLGQRCTVNTNEREPCLLTSPLQAEGERQIKTLCLNAYPPLETVLAAEKNIVYIGIDYVNSINSVWFFSSPFFGLSLKPHSAFVL